MTVDYWGNTMPKQLDVAIDNYNKHMEDHDYPACFDTEKDFVVWCQLEHMAPTKVCRKLVCRDCCPEYQKKMTRAGRCFNSEVDLSKIAK